MKLIFAILFVLSFRTLFAQFNNVNNQNFIGVYYIHTGFNYPMQSQQLFLDILQEDFTLNDDLYTSKPAYVPTGHSDGLGMDFTKRKKRKNGEIQEWRLGLELVLHRQASMHHREFIYTETSTTERHINLVHHEKLGKVKLEYLKHPSWWRSCYWGVGAEVGQTFDEWIYVFYQQLQTPAPGNAKYDETPQWAENPYMTANSQISTRGYIVLGLSLRLGKSIEFTPQFGIKTGYNKVCGGSKYLLPIEFELKAALHFNKAPGSYQFQEKTVKNKHKKGRNKGKIIPTAF